MSPEERRTPRVKICGVTTANDRDAVIRAGADAIGFISKVPVETPRELPASEAADLVAGVPPLVSSVLVTMPEDVAAARSLLERVHADAIQVHGGLTPADVEKLRKRVRANVIAAVDVDDEQISDYANAADALLVDSTDEQGGGGTGETHDWEQTRLLVEELETPVVLAGGLTAENVREAVETVHPYGVDTATGVERTGGEKDHDAITQFVRRARRPGVSN